MKIPEMIRFSPPHAMDKMPMDTECHVRKKNGEFDVYVQRNTDENEPHWILLKENVHCDSTSVE